MLLKVNGAHGVHRLAPPLLKMTLFRMKWLNIHGAHRSKPIMSSPPPFECVTEQKDGSTEPMPPEMHQKKKKTCRTVRFDDNISCRWRTGFRSGLLFGCPCRASLLTPNGC